MAKEEIKVENKTQKIESGRIKSRVNYDIIVKYDGRDCVIAPRQVLDIPDMSKLGKYDPKEIVKIK